MRGDGLSVFHFAAFPQVLGDAGAPEGVTGRGRGKSSASGAAFDHGPGFSAVQWLIGELPTPEGINTAEQGSLRLIPEFGGVKLGIEIFLQLVVNFQGVLLAAFLVQADEPAPPLLIVIFHSHVNHGTDPAKGVEHRGE